MVKGYLYQRGKKGFFYLQYVVEKKKVRVALRDADGMPITNRRIAEAAMAEVLAPLVAKDKASALRRVQGAIEDAEAKAVRVAEKAAQREKARIDAERDSKAAIEEGWSLFMSCRHRPISCRRYTVHTIPPHSTASNYRSFYGRFREFMANRHKGCVLLTRVSVSMAQEFMDEVERMGSSGTFNKYLQFLQMFYETLSVDGVIRKCNPFSGIERVSLRFHSKRPLSREQIARLIGTATGETRVLFAIGYFTGLRLGDCCTLLWREVDLGRRILERVPRKTAHRVKDLSQSVVKVGIPNDLYALLEPLPRQSVYVLPSMAELYLKREDAVSAIVARLFRECGIETSFKGENGRAIVVYGFHSLRYSYISHNAEAGTPQALIQRNAGHSSPAMTEHYTKVSDATAVKIASVLSFQDDDVASLRARARRIVDAMSSDALVEFVESRTVAHNISAQ